MALVIFCRLSLFLEFWAAVRPRAQQVSGPGLDGLHPSHRVSSRQPQRMQLRRRRSCPFRGLTVVATSRRRRRPRRRCTSIDLLSCWGCLVRHPGYSCPPREHQAEDPQRRRCPELCAPRADAAGGERWLSGPWLPCHPLGSLEFVPCQGWAARLFSAEPSSQLRQAPSASPSMPMDYEPAWLLLQLLEGLERGIYTGYDGCLLRQPLPPPLTAFYSANRKVSTASPPPLPAP